MNPPAIPGRLRARVAAALIVAMSAVAVSVSATPAEAAQPSVVAGSRAAIVAGAKYAVDREVPYGRSAGYGHSTRGPGPTASLANDARITWADGFLDCSGLVRYAYSRAGIDLGTGGTNAQVKQFYALPDASAALPGDVVFFGEHWDGKTASQKDYRDPETGIWWNVTHISVTDGAGHDYEAVAPGSVAAYGNVSTKEGWYVGYFRLKSSVGTLDGAAVEPVEDGTVTTTTTGGTVECGSDNPDRDASTQYCHGVREWQVDVDGDDRADIVDFASVTATKADAGGARGWRTSRGAPVMTRWTAALDTLTGPTTTSLEYGDFDGDGHTDVMNLTGLAGGETTGWQIAYGTATSAFTPWVKARTSTVTSANAQLELGDFDGDGATDVLWFTGASKSAVAAGQPYGWVIAYGGARGSMSGWRSVLASTATPAKQRLALGDFDGDGRTDVLQFTGRTPAQHPQLYGWVVAYGRESRSFSWPASVLPSTATPASTPVELGDFDGDGSTDVLAFTGSTWAVSYGGVRGDMPPAVTVLRTDVTPVKQRLALGDFDGDGRTDVLWFTGRASSQDGSPAGWAISYGRGNRSMTRWADAVARGVTPSSREIALGDVDGDGSTDVLQFTGVTKKAATGATYGWQASWGGTRGTLGAWSTVRNTAIQPSTWRLSVEPL
ncbi:C40 family peptidase [Demequina phytophila]|uniref:C40 family peptidase n=1 Tax=Demequina phytophila TaxID=1638981 RepID=UPI00078560C7|nr:FG-GAP-like repeat-containing protein [Demequina phytophila]